MMVTCKFLKRVTFVKGVDIWLAEQWVHAFFKRLDLIDQGLARKFITAYDLKFLSKFWKTLYTKLGVQLLYNTTYHSQTDRFSERINSTVKSAMQFIIHAIEDIFCWPEVLPQIQSLLNNTSFFITGKTPNKVTYRFSSKRLLNLLLATTLFNTYIAHTIVADAISFILTNQKAHYNRKFQSLFMKVWDQAMLRPYEGYLIFFSIRVIRKLIQQYVGLFQVKEKVSQLIYRLNVPSDQRIYPVFSEVQLDPALGAFIDLFWHLRPQQLHSVFVQNNTDKLKLSEIECLFNKCTIKKVKSWPLSTLFVGLGIAPNKTSNIT